MRIFFHKLKKTALAVLFFALALSACSLTDNLLASEQETGEKSAAVTPTAERRAGLPPSIIETQPLNGSRIGTQEEIVFYFNQPMERASVERSLRVEPNDAGSFRWDDDATLRFTPNESLGAASNLKIAFEAGAKSALGEVLGESLSYSFQTAEMLHPVQVLPEDGSTNLGVDTAVAVSFDQPIFPLGADAEAFPAAFQMEPAAEGRGEWLNTSTYIFYPEALEGGTEYSVRLNPELRSLAGTSLEGESSWSFSTARPRLLEIDPPTETPLPLDLAWTFRFNQPMDKASVEANFALLDAKEEAVKGNFEWADDLRSFLFTTDEPLARDSAYRLLLSSKALAQGGTPLSKDWDVEVYSAPHFEVLSTNPKQTGVLDEYLAGNITFSTAVGTKRVEDYLSVKPQVADFSADVYGNELYFQGDFAPETHYTLRIAPELEDIWGESLGKEFYYSFAAPKPEPKISFPYLSNPFYFTSAESPSFYIQAVNVPSVSMTLGEIPLADFFPLFAMDGYDLRESYQPANPISWREYLQNEENKSETFRIDISPNGEALSPGFYSLLLWKTGKEGSESPNYLVASNVNLVFKFSATDAFLWATDLQTNAFLVGQPVGIYAEDGTILAEGITDEQGLWRGKLPVRENPYEKIYAMLGKPGDKNFGFSASFWGENFSPWNFNLQEDFRPPHSEVYLYTDKPIYHPGEKVYFRAVLRDAYDGLYNLPKQKSLPLTLSNGEGENIAALNPPLSAYGTAHDFYLLPKDAPSGYYSFYNSELHFSAYFQVAEYRKPEINLTINLNAAEIKKGEKLHAEIAAQYYFGAAASNLPLRWTLYEDESRFTLPDYEVGKLNLDDFTGEIPRDYYGSLLAEGEEKTDASGHLNLDFDTASISEGMHKLTLEITLVDENGQWISQREQIAVHPEEFYIGIRPDTWFGREETEMGFDIRTVNWKTEPYPNQSLYAAFQQVTWEKQNNGSYLPVFTPVSDVDFVTGEDGAARLSFTPPRPGTYVLDLRGGNAASQMMIWVTGADKSLYPNLPRQRVQLVPDQDKYQPGETAKIFIPNPLNQAAQALITVERGTVRTSEIISVEAGGTTYELPLTEQDAPTLYLSAVLLTASDFRVGYTQINISAASKILNVALTSDPMRTEPGGIVHLNLRVTDNQGAPVQGEFSVAIVDLATFALAEPNSETIETAFYGTVGLGVRTSLSLAGNSRYGVFSDVGVGGIGGGGDELPSVRKNFPDTAYWNAEILTDENGEAHLNVPLPDNLTTWQIDLRGLTEDTRVGSAKLEIISTKDLLIRPVTPRFLVLGDHVEIAAIVHNNTAEELSGKITLQAVGFLLDNPESVTQKITVPAGGRIRVTWWGKAQDAETAELLFNAQLGRYTDTTRPTGGALPILRYTSPQTFVTAGKIDQARKLTEAVSLPRSFIPNGGKLEVTLDASLASVLLEKLHAQPLPKTTASNEEIASYLLPNLAAYRALQTAELEDHDLNTRLETSIEAQIQRLLRNQNTNGSWNWYTQAENLRSAESEDNNGDPYLSAYILLGLSQAKDTDIYIEESVFINAREYLHKASLPILAAAETERWQKDRLAFIQYVMQISGGADAVAVDQLYLWKDDLSPWAQALLALNLESRKTGDARAASLLSNLKTSARRSASGAHWESNPASRQNPGSPAYTTAIVLYALAQTDPASPLTDEALRYLNAHIDTKNAWTSSYENAWGLLALAETLKNTRDINANYPFSVDLNGTEITQGQADPLHPQIITIPLENLQPTLPNALNLTRGEGKGSLYYQAALSINRPAETAPALNRGINISRSYYNASCQENCLPLKKINLAKTQRIKVQLTLNLTEDSYYLMIEDSIPAGTEILNRRLDTAQRSYETETITRYDPAHPFTEGWGWWLFSPPQIEITKIRWTADYLPAGTYLLSYTLIPTQIGEYRVLPAKAWQTYFPEIQGTTQGNLFTIE